MIPFNKPYYTGKEVDYVRQAFERQHTAGNGYFTKLCQKFFEERCGFAKCLLTQSCTDALEMCALLARIQPGDEVILPSYTFVSTANAFALRGAALRFADSEAGRPHLDTRHVEKLITPRTRAIVVVHYGGTSVDLLGIAALARKHGILLIEDAAHAIESFYHGQPLGSFGDLSAFSFHETKNIISGEGGMLVINNPELILRAEILWEKGTNRSAFFRGEVAKYQWMDVGSSFLPSEITAAALWSQIQAIDDIQSRRVSIWRQYESHLSDVAEKFSFSLPLIQEGETVNGHLFYLTCASLEERTALITWLRERQIQAVFHYQCLHSSPYHSLQCEPDDLQSADRFSDCLLRLPFYYELSDSDIRRISSSVREFYEQR